MNAEKIVLLLDEEISKPTDAFIAHWQKRDVPPNELSLVQMLDEELVDIRTEHMDWAYAAGFIPHKGKHLHEHLEAGEKPSMWWTSLLYERHPKLSPYLYPLYKLRCLEKLLLQKNCAILEIYGNDDSLAKIIANLCSGLKINFKYHKSGKAISAKKPLKERLYFLCPAPIRALARLFFWHWSVKRKLPWPKDGPELLNQPTASIVTYFPNIDLHAATQGRFHSRYWERLHSLLREEAENAYNGRHFVNWLFIRFPSPDLSFDQCMALLHSFRDKKQDGLSFHYLEEFLSLKDILLSLKRWLNLTIKSYSLQKLFASNCHFKNSRLNFWALLDEQWAESFRGWRCLERCLQNRAFNNYVGYIKKQRWVLFPLENCPWERMLTQAVHSTPNPYPVYGAQHSIIRRTDFRYFDAPQTFSNPACESFQPDMIGGNGKSACDQLLSNHMPPKRLVQLEALRYLYLSQDNAPPSSIPPAPGEPLIDSSQKRLILLTSFFADETEAHLELLGKVLDAGLLKDWLVEIKPHPYLPVEGWVEARPKEDQIRIISSPMNEILKPGAIFWTSNSTTSALEAALKHLPLMVMASVNDFDLCPIQNIKDLVRTATVSDVANALNSLHPLAIEDGYLDLDTQLNGWKRLLGLS